MRDGIGYAATVGRKHLLRCNGRRRKTYRTEQLVTQGLGEVSEAANRWWASTHPHNQLSYGLCRLPSRIIMSCGAPFNRLGMLAADRHADAGQRIREPYRSHSCLGSERLGGSACRCM